MVFYFPVFTNGQQNGQVTINDKQSTEEGQLRLLKAVGHTTPAETKRDWQ